MKTPHKFFIVISQKFEHILEAIFRITAVGDKRIEAGGEDRITADSEP